MTIPELRDLSLCVTEYQRTLDEGYNMAVREMQETLRDGWINADIDPVIKAGTDKYFLIAVRRQHDGKIYSFPAVYCNDYPLMSDDPRDADGAGWTQRVQADGDEDCDILVTGWYDVRSDSEYDNRYSPSLNDGDELVAWKEVEKYPS